MLGAPYVGQLRPSYLYSRYPRDDESPRLSPTTHSDVVYSFGSIMLQILSHIIITSAKVVHAISSGRHRCGQAARWLRSADGNTTVLVKRRHRPLSEGILEFAEEELANCRPPDIVTPTSFEGVDDALPRTSVTSKSTSTRQHPSPDQTSAPDLHPSRHQFPLEYLRQRRSLNATDGTSETNVEPPSKPETTPPEPESPKFLNPKAAIQPLPQDDVRQDLGVSTTESKTTSLQLDLPLLWQMGTSSG
ncbi:hypothetical protein L210DRAFT_3761860 [Boletus edulis BED1]|uniref:Uncharacterized protein n=1 Tax=Boletus edulis BED1 TaxID=1328754 RepID=A0AAD4BQY9_BOLED|nr:hypothetical protein L210DRAFT_3761860 [Boletus edulis BED1]